MSRNTRREFFSSLNNATFCKSRRLQTVFSLKLTSEYSITILMVKVHIRIFLSIPYVSQGITDYCSNILKILQAIAVKLCKFVSVSQRGGLIASRKRDALIFFIFKSGAVFS